MFPYLVSDGNEIVRACDRYSNETVILRKHVTKYKHMRKWMAKTHVKMDNQFYTPQGMLNRL